MVNKLKVLIVDDEVINIDIVSEVLKNNYTIISTSNALYTLKIVGDEKPNLILLDIIMPNISGLEICKQLKENPETKDIPIIFITSVEDEDIIEEAFEVGGTDYVTKPFRSKELISRIKTQLNIKSMENELKLLAATDFLTNLYNRRYFNQISIHTLDLSKRLKQDVSIIMIDIDKFKKINDTYGHAIGDKVIVSLANKLIHSQRKSDIACRYGGEEFVLLLANTSIKGAEVLAKKLKNNIENSVINIDSNEIKFTVSIGISQVYINSENDINNALHRADTALYKAKQTGRNKICIS